MTPLTLSNFALDRSGLAATLSLHPGQSLVVMGPGGSGKSRFVRACLGLESPVRGSAKLGCQPEVASRPEGKRLRPQRLAQSEKGSEGAARASEALSATGLWDARQVPLGELSPSQLAACELLAPLASASRLLVADGQLDLLDAWALRGVLSLLRTRLAEGAALLVATNRLDLLAEFERLALLKANRLRYVGKVSDLLGRQEDAIVVETNAHPGVRAMEEPFAIHLEETADGMRMTAREGQERAARLLLEGYGDVKAVVARRKSASEIAMELLDGP